MKPCLHITMALILIQSCVVPPTPPDNGVSLSLSKERKGSISKIEYDLYFLIPESKLEMITAHEIMRFHCTQFDDLALDFKESALNLLQIQINGSEIPAEIINEHIIIPKKHLQEDNVVEIQFIAGNLSLNRNDEYLYTLLVPDRARTVFPVMDQPNLKAKWKLSLDIPASWEAISNAPVSSVDLVDDRKKISFDQTRPISSYLFAFAAGKFQKITSENGEMNMYYRESDTSKVKRNAPEIFNLHRHALNWLENYTGIKYPFQKFDFALIPTFQYGGMEHPGSIFYRERSLMLDESASVNQKLRRASLIAHETAHMWFGDLVTMDWFNDVWLKEVFANFMAAKIVNPSFPEVNHDLRFLLSHYPGAYEIDRSEGTHPIQQELDNLQNAGSLYGAIIYQKAPIVMRNLESIIGQEPFQTGLKEYLNRFSYKNATWDDLIGILSQHTDQDLRQWNHDWVKSAGMPEIAIEYKDENLNFQVINRTDQLYWPQQIQIRIKENHLEFLLNQKYLQPTENSQYNINSNGHTYGYLNGDETTIKNVWESVQGQNEIERASGWMFLWESFLHGKIKTDSFYNELLIAIPHEKNALILEYLTGKIQTLFWNFLDIPSRNVYRDQTEEALFKEMMQVSDQSLKRNFYNSYTSIATSKQGISNLYQIWAGKLPEFDLTLYENDQIRLALELILREIDNAEDIINKQLEATENPDNRKRMEFLLPAVSPDLQVRDQFFTSLLKEENRNQEPWVSEALTYLHHALRADSAVKYVLPGLEVIEEIKTTGDIFFPKAWLDATLSGHRSKEVAEIVRSFLENNPALPSDLRNKILQSADLLFRNQEIKN